MNRVRALFPTRQPVVGMVHLAPLPGSPGFGGSLDDVTTRALRDAGALLDGGVDAVLVENFGDAPFFPDQVPAITVAAITCVLDRLRRSARRTVPWGVNVLRNDAAAALAVATATGAEFIRVNVLIGAAVTDQGLIQGRAHELVRSRAATNPRLAILADVAVKHARPLAPRPLSEEIADLVERGGADAVLLTGERTGVTPSRERLEAARAVLGRPSRRTCPLWLASGVDARVVASTASSVEGWIVGSAFERGGRAGAPVDRARVRRFIATARLHRGATRTR